MLNSGTSWLGNYFSAVAKEKNYRFYLNGAVINKQAAIRLALAGVSSGKHSFLCYFNDLIIGSVPDFYGSSSDYISINNRKFEATINSGLINGYNRLKIEYQPTNDAALAYMDWIELDFYRQLKTDDNQLFFYSPDSSGFYQYSIKSFSTNFSKKV